MNIHSLELKEYLCDYQYYFLYMFVYFSLFSKDGKFSSYKDTFQFSVGESHRPSCCPGIKLMIDDIILTPTTNFFVVKVE